MRVSPLFHLISDQLLFIRLINYSINCENLLQKKRKERKEGTVKKVSTTNLERRNLERERSLDRTTFNPPGVENSKAITNHDSSYPLRKWAVRSYWTHRSGDTLPLSLSDFWRWATRFPGFDFFVSFTVGRDTACRGNDIGVVPAKLAGQERKLDRTRGMERDACVSRSRVHWPEIILACRAVVPRRPLRYPIPCFVFFILFIFPPGNFAVTNLFRSFPSEEETGKWRIILYFVHDFSNTFNNNSMEFELSLESSRLRKERNYVKLQWMLTFILFASREYFFRPSLSRTNWTNGRGIRFERTSFPSIGLNCINYTAKVQRSVPIHLRSFFSVPSSPSFLTFHRRFVRKMTRAE